MVHNMLDTWALAYAFILPLSAWLTSHCLGIPKHLVEISKHFAAHISPAENSHRLSDLCMASHKHTLSNSSSYRVC